MDSFSSGEFIQGFLEEASEHLPAIQQNLLNLEQSLDLPESASLAVDRKNRIGELFRSLHTLKGLSGMIGLEPAAQLIHSMEAVLQAVQKGRLAINADVLDRLVASTQALEEVIRTLRSPETSMPDVEAHRRALAALIDPPSGSAAPAPEVKPPRPAGAEPAAAAPAPASAAPASAGRSILPSLDAYPEVVKALNETDWTRLQVAINEGLLFSLAVFTPSSIKSDRGENIDQIRQQIMQAGEIIKAVPVLKAGGIRFMFLVASTAAVTPDQVTADEIIPLPREDQTPKPSPQPVEVAIARPVVSNFVRVDLARLDEMMKEISDLVIQRGRLGLQLQELGSTVPVDTRRALLATYQQMGITLRDLRRSLTRARLVPLSEAFNHVPLVVRDLVRSTGKQVRLVIEGEDSQVDKMLVERLLDPLVHLVRNALIHGIESPAEREAAGKPAQSTLRIIAVPEGSHMTIVVEDDGQGISTEKIAARASALGYLAEGRVLDENALLDVISRPGFSTREQADLSAGRGIGLEIVQKTLRSFGGSLSMSTTPGRGTRFIMRLPVSLLITAALVIQCGTEQYAVPQEQVNEVVEVDPRAITTIESGELYVHRGQAFSVRRFEDLVALDRSDERRKMGLICPAGAQPVLVLVDRVLGLREVVVQTTSDPLIAHKGISGSTELGDGRVVLIVNAPDLLRRQPV